jgi:predicted outer membrane protein
MRAYIDVELQAATLGQTHASDPSVRAAASQMLADFTASKSDLDALEGRLAVAEAACPESQRVSADLTADLAQAQSAGPATFDAVFIQSQVAALSEIKQVVNDDLIGCAANGDLKTSLRFDRRRTVDGGGDAAYGVVPDLAAFDALFDGGAAQTDAALDGASGG